MGVLLEPQLQQRAHESTLYPSYVIPHLYQCNTRLRHLPDLGGVPWSLVKEAVLLLSSAAKSATYCHFQGLIHKGHNNDQPAIQGRSGLRLLEVTLETTKGTVANNPRELS